MAFINFLNSYLIVLYSILVPDSIWTINEKSDTDRNENDNFNWWDQVNLTKLILASNKLRIIPKNVQSLNSLVILDVIIIIILLDLFM